MSIRNAAKEASAQQASATERATAPAVSHDAACAPGIAAADAAASETAAALAPDDALTRRLQEIRSNPRAWHREIISLAFDMQKAADRITAPLRRRHDLTQQQLLVLVRLENEPDQRPSHISDDLGILRANFTSLCHKLEKRGLVRRTPCKSDRRAYELHLTAAGHALLDELDAEVDAASKRVLDEMSDEAAIGLIEGCRALRAVYDRMSEVVPCSES